MTPQDTRTLAHGVALARIAIGSAAILAPGLAMRVWLGVDSRSHKVKAMGLAIGARDVALGAGTLRALGRGGDPAVWLKAGSLADAADGLGTLRAFGGAPANPRMLIGFIAAGVATASWVLGRQLEELGRRSG